MNEDAMNTAAAQGGSMIGGLIGLAILVFLIAAMWKVFTKAGKAGWLVLIPIVNIYQLLKIAGRPGWWLILLIIPLVNLIISILVSMDIAKSFGKGAGFGLGLAFLGPIFYPILGFGSATYKGPAAA
ncbi:MAG: DUF5684 domain-containing protein [Verrucomicrobiaceae bacterium]|nr:DUF5684 domain-containing protein [Verrucomicrobiaceae bacterium]